MWVSCLSYNCSSDDGGLEDDLLYKWSNEIKLWREARVVVSKQSSPDEKVLSQYNYQPYRQ